jgi:hypothetical protein
MANVGGAASGALSGAAAGSALGPWGTAAGAALGLVSSLMAGDGGAAQQQEISRNQLQQAQNSQAYTQALNAEAMRRSTAGSTDAQGNTIRYDPATNSWVSALGKAPAQIQGGINSATQLHNTVDVPQSVQNNAASSIMASLARRGMSGALNNLNSYQPKTQAEVQGALQDSSTRANQTVQAPIIADTLRQFARTGTAAGPVLAQLQRASSDSLSKEMSDNTIRAMTGAGEINSANRQALTVPITTLTAAGTPNQQNTAPSYTPGPAAELASQINGRAASSGQIAASSGNSGAYGAIAGNQAAKLASDNAMNGLEASQLAGAYKSIGNLKSSGAFDGLGDSVNRWFNGTQGVDKGFGQFGPPDPRQNPYYSSPDYSGFNPTPNS